MLLRLSAPEAAGRSRGRGREASLGDRQTLSLGSRLQRQWQRFGGELRHGLWGVSNTTDPMPGSVSGYRQTCEFAEVTTSLLHSLFSLV